MDTPQVTDGEFVDSVLFNDAISAFMTSLTQVGEYLHTPGLVNPSSLVFTPTNLVVEIEAPLPFQVLFSSGYLVGAHGTVEGADTTTYSLNMASLVPTSGSSTVYILAEYTQVGENPTTIVGPPPGQPDYNPNFAPFEFYTVERDSLAIVASTTAANNTTTFELARITLTEGQFSIQSDQIITTYWQYASAVLDPTGVTPGTYSNVSITVGEDGRITSASAAPDLGGVLTGALPDPGFAANPAFTGTASATEGFVSSGLDSGGANFRFYTTESGYGAAWLNNNSNAYLLLTSEGDALGTYNTLRPLTINVSTGAVSIDGTGAGTAFGGGVTIADALTVGDGATIDGNATFTGSTITVEGSAAIDGALTVGDGATIDGNATVTGAASVGGNLTVDEVLYLGTTGQFYLNWNNDGSQLLNFAANNYLQFVPNEGFYLYTGGTITLQPGDDATYFQLDGDEFTAYGACLRASIGAYGSGDSARAVLLGDFEYLYGFQRLPNGMILMQGSGSVGGAGSTHVAFPYAFPNACDYVFTTIVYSGNIANETVGATSYTTTGFSLGSTGPLGYAYLAVGY